MREKSWITLTDNGKLSPLLQLSNSETENERIWADLPEIADYQQLGPLRPAATTLLNVNVDGRMQPLLVTQPYGRGQSYILATGGTWRWQVGGELEGSSARPRARLTLLTRAILS